MTTDPRLRPLLERLLATGTIVALLTWLVMPLLTRLLAPWLFASTRAPKETYS